MKRLQDIDAGVVPGLFGPLLLYFLWWKVQRLGMLPRLPGLATVDLLRPELLLHAALLSAWLGLVLLQPVRWMRLKRLGLLGVYLLLGSVEFLCHGQFMISGAAMDAALFGYAVQNLGAATVAFDALTLPAMLLAGLVVLAPIPWILKRPEALPPHPLARRDGLRLLGLGALCAVLSMLPPVTAEVPRSVARHIPGQLLVTLFRVPLEPLAAAPFETVRITGQSKKNLVFISLESVRFDATTVYDKALATTPVMAELAARSLVVGRAYSPMPHSTKAMVPMLCGIDPEPGLVVTEAQHLPVDCLPRLLGDLGYATVHFRSATEHFENWRGLCEQLGFGDFVPPEEMSTEGFEPANYFGWEDDIMLEPSRAWLEQHAGQPIFAFYLAGTPHHDYQTPTRYGMEPFSEDEEYNRYLNSVRYTDAFVGKLIAQYKELGLYEDTLFVLVGDHGEGFGEQLPRQHNTNPYEPGLRVPMLFHAAWLEPDRVEGPATQLDLLPTMVELLGLQAVGAEGASLLHPLPDRILHASCWYDERCLVSWQGQDKLVHHFGDRPDERFRVLEDPLEQQDLGPDPERQEELLRWHREVMGRWQQSRPAP